MTTEEAESLRQELERDILALLQDYCDATGLTPVSVEVKTTHITRLADSRPNIALSGVRVTVWL